MLVSDVAVDHRYPRKLKIHFRGFPLGRAFELDVSPWAVAGDPEKTIQKAQQILAAANAPLNPSGQDRAGAAQASQREQAARAELAEKQRQEQTKAFEANQPS